MASNASPWHNRPNYVPKAVVGKRVAGPAVQPRGSVNRVIPSRVQKPSVQPKAPLRSTPLSATTVGRGYTRVPVRSRQNPTLACTRTLNRAPTCAKGGTNPPKANVLTFLNQRAAPPKVGMSRIPPKLGTPPAGAARVDQTPPWRSAKPPPNPTPNGGTRVIGSAHPAPRTDGAADIQQEDEDELSEIEDVVEELLSSSDMDDEEDKLDEDPPQDNDNIDDAAVEEDLHYVPVPDPRPRPNFAVRPPLRAKPSFPWQRRAIPTPSAHEVLDIEAQQETLPIRQKSDEVMPHLCGESKVCCLVGETGSGKSTQVPQMLLEQSWAEGRDDVRIAVTQPRRVAALNLARRVGTELGETGAGNTVGYRIGGESIRGKQIEYCTVGFLLQLFLNAPEEFGQYTHIVLDEVHERSSESDMLCLVVKLLISSYPDTRVVVMSATLQSDLFADYFTMPQQPPPSKVFVGARCHPVTEYYLEEFAAVFKGQFKCEGQVNVRIKDAFSGKGGGKGASKGDKAKNMRLDPKHSEKFHKIICSLIECIAEQDSTILVFLPGIAEISALWEEARYLEEQQNVKVFPLHSMIPREEQEMVFQEPTGGVTNVVLATDIAESSITLPRVVAVIDLGLHRRMDHSSSNGGVASLSTKWISRAAAKQRAGRAGRTQPGICLRLYPRSFHDESMVEFEPPETESMPLDRLYLQAKQLAGKLEQALGSKLAVPASAEGLLRKMVQCPSLTAIGAARRANADLGVITAPKESGKITSLGRLCLQLPVDLKLARLVWLGAKMGVAADAVILASVLSSMDPFSSPSPLFLRDETVFLDKLRSSVSARLLFDGGMLSEPLMQRQLFLEWLTTFHKAEWVYGDKERIFQARRRHTRDFSVQFSLHKGRMEHTISHVLDTALRVFRSCSSDSKPAKQLRHLIRGLGYVVNDRGDLAGMSWNQWRQFKTELVFEPDSGYLKALLATSFSDQLFVGGYGTMQTSLECEPPKSRTEKKKPKASSNIERAKAQFAAIAENGIEIRQAVVFGDGAGTPGGCVQDVATYINFVCGNANDRSVFQINEPESFCLSEIKSGSGDRWRGLESRETAPLLECQTRLSAEFNLLYAFEKSMRDVQRAKALGAGNWTYSIIPVEHPSILHWEWMQPALGGKTRLTRIAGMFERKNATGFVGYVPPQTAEEAGQHLNRVAAIAVSASVQAGDNAARLYPSGATVLAIGHIAFVMASAKIEPSTLGFRTFGFTTSGSLTIMHRCLELPPCCLDKIRWGHVSRLREALRNELQVPEDVPADGKWQAPAPCVNSNTQVESVARALYASVPHADGGKEATADKLDSDPVEALRWRIDLDGPADDGPQAFRPLASWTDLEARRQEIMKKDGRDLPTALKPARESERDRERDKNRDRRRSPRRDERRSVKRSRRDDDRSRRDDDRSYRDRRPERREDVDTRRPERDRSRRRRRDSEDAGSRKSKDPANELASTLGFYELTRQVTGRCKSVSTELERSRVIVALNEACSDPSLTSVERRKVRRRLDDVEVTVKNCTLSGSRDTGYNFLIACLSELENRQRDLDRGRDRDRHHCEHRSSRVERGGCSERDPGRLDSRGGVDRQRSDELVADIMEHAEHAAELADQTDDTAPTWVEGHWPWVRCVDEESGNYFYFNEETQASMWEHPSTLAD